MEQTHPTRVRSSCVAIGPCGLNSLVPYIALLLGLVLASTGCQGGTNSIDLNQRLTRGVNLQLASAPTSGEQATGPFSTPAVSDLKLIRKLGFGHVRIRVNPEELMTPEGLNRNRTQQLHKIITRINNHQLSVILTHQPNSEFKTALQPKSAALSAFAEYWRALARRLSDISPAALVFEAINEPETESAQDWQRIQEQLVAAIRAGAPEHYIVVTGHDFSSLPELLQIQPLAYDNLLYSFHFYEPPNFTHQGANWGWPMWQLFHDWPYPSSPQAVAPLLAEHAPQAREHLAYYGEQHWNKAKLAEALDRAAGWAQQHNVSLICTEFGVYRDGVAPAYREAWLADVTQLLQARDINWTLWAYSGNFGLVSEDPGLRVLDKPAALALGLKASGVD